MKKTLNTDPEFRKLSIPSKKEELLRLEESLLREACKDAILVWDGYILDGHKRYEICSYEEIELKVKKMNFRTKEEAALWICSRRLEEQKKGSVPYRYLAGEKCLLEKRFWEVSDGKQKDGKTVASKVTGWRGTGGIAEELGIHESSLHRCKKFAKAMDCIAEKDFELFEAIKAGTVEITFQKADEYAEMERRKLAEIRRKLLGEDRIRMRHRSINPDKAAGKKKKAQPEQEMVPLQVGIKDMPAYDPDMEFRGLALTIPVWMNAIARAQTKTDPKAVSDGTKLQLAGILHRLEDEITKMLEVIES